jgi:SHS2 domain-containing protein
METQVVSKKPRRHFRNSISNLEFVKPKITVTVEACSLQELFKESLKRMANTLKSKIYNPTRHTDCMMKIEVEAANSKDLLKKFLNQVLELTYTHHTIFCTMYIEELTENKINAQLFGNWFDIFDNKLKHVPENGITMTIKKASLNPFNSSIIFNCENDL